jgi:Zn ribbon nucleic-acid-binding protein
MRSYNGSREVLMFDAEGSFDDEPCPACGSKNTITYRYEEGFSELECRVCGFRSDQDELSELQRYSGDLLETEHDTPPVVPFKSMKA